jgi:hypothetical protein
MANQALSEKYSIEIDCAPGTPRPDTVLPLALSNTEMKVEDFEKTSTFFGNWTYVPLLEKEELYANSQNTIAENLKQAYAKGKCRYCSW